MKGPSIDRDPRGPMATCARCGHAVVRKTLRPSPDGPICVRCSMGPVPLTDLERAVQATPYSAEAAARSFPATDYRKRAMVRRRRRR